MAVAFEKMLRWRLGLQSLKFNIVHRSGIFHQAADLFFRLGTVVYLGVAYERSMTSNDDTASDPCCEVFGIILHKAASAGRRYRRRAR